MIVVPAAVTLVLVPAVMIVRVLLSVAARMRTVLVPVLAVLVSVMAVAGEGFGGWVVFHVGGG